jgi:hypothetical protein
MSVVIFRSHAVSLGIEIKGVAMAGHVVCKGKREMLRTEPTKRSERFLGNQAQNFSEFQ